MNDPTLYRMLILGISLSFAAGLPIQAAETPPQVLSPSPLKAAGDWFSVQANEDAAIPESLLSTRPLTADVVGDVGQELWRAYRDSETGHSLAALLPDPYMIEPNETPTPQACRLVTGRKIMPFYFVGKGQLPEKPPLFIALHGGGSAGGRSPSPHGWSVNTREWNIQLRLCARIYPNDALYFIPRMADDNDGRWYFNYCQNAYDRVIRAVIAQHNVDPNRIYLIGISEGAYTAYRMGAFMADRWAGAGSMAGGEPLNNAPPENMRNLAFRADVGENDTRFDRLGLNQRYGQALETLKKDDPEGFNYQINVQLGRGHSIDDEPCPKWIYQYTRNPWPTRVTWKVIKVHGRRKKQFYWLALDEDPTSWPLYIDARIEAQTNRVIVSIETEDEDGKRVPANDIALRVYLNDRMLDLDQPVVVVRNGAEVFQGPVTRQASTMLRSLAERGDPSYMFPAQIVLPAKENARLASSEAEQKLLQNMPRMFGRFLTRLLDEAGDNRDQIVGALLATSEANQPAAFTIISQLPREELQLTSQTALIELIDTMAPVLSQESDRRQQRALAAKLIAAGPNRSEIIRFLGSTPDEHRTAALFMVANMPQRDLTSLSADFLTENLTLAYKAWEESPWYESIPEQLFLQYILPYANLNERRDDWRQDFMNRLQQKAWSYSSPIEATIWLNNQLNDLFKVYFHATKRPKPDQSPYESIEAGYASCTGLSVLLADACRSVGIPARIVGIPLWTEVQGNHNWVEVWDGQWQNVGGTGSDPCDDDWVNQRCLTQTDPDQWRHTVYAACFRPTSLHFPLVWDETITYVDALNVTRFYSHRQTAKIEIPEPGRATVEVYWAGEIIAKTSGEKEVELTLAGGNVYHVRITTADGKTHEQILRL